MPAQGSDHASLNSSKCRSTRWVSLSMLHPGSSADGMATICLLEALACSHPLMLLSPDNHNSLP